MHVDGSCHCGAIRFRAQIDPNRVGVCHCTDCQVFSGSAFRTSVLVPAADFELLAGEPAVYVKTAESGNSRSLCFCGVCGTHLWGETGGQGGGVRSVRVGTLAQRADLAPRVQVWCRSSLPWLGQLDEATRFETQPGA